MASQRRTYRIQSNVFSRMIFCYLQNLYHHWKTTEITPKYYTYNKIIPKRVPNIETNNIHPEERYHEGEQSGVTCIRNIY